MSNLAEIRQRQARLLARAALERERLAVQLAAWEKPAALLDRGVSALRRVRSHPGWLFAAACAIALLRPRRALSWARRGFTVWRLWRWGLARVRDLAGDLPR